MKLGVALPLAGGRSALASAELAEAIGIDAVFVFDHYSRTSEPGRLIPNSPFALLGSIAAATTRIELGTLVFRAPSQPPSVSAHAFRTLNEISEGRCIAGLGLGGAAFERELSDFGAERTLLSEPVIATRRLLAELVAHKIDCWVGGRGEKAAQIADEYNIPLNLWNVSPSEVEKRISATPPGRGGITWAGSWVFSTQSPSSGRNLADYLTLLSDAGASWAVVAPRRVDSQSDLRTAYLAISEAWVSRS